MGAGTRIFKNTTYLTLGDKVGYLIQFIFFLYFAREFGVVPTGEYSFGFTFTYSFVVFADLGIGIYLVREVARTPSGTRRLFFDCLVLRALFIIFVLLLASLVLVTVFDDIPAKKLKVIAFWGGYWMLYSLADVFLAELNGHEKMGQVALLGLFLKLTSTIAGTILIYLGLDYSIVLIVLPISSFAYLTACIIVSFYYFGPVQITFEKISHYKNLLSKLLPFCLSVILVEVLWCQDILILGFLHDDHSVGIYSCAIKLVAFILGMSPFFHIAMLPVLSKLFSESKKELIDVSNKILRYLILFSLPISCGIFIISDKIISLLYSNEFNEAGIVLKISGWVISAGLVQAIFSVLLTSIDRQKEKVVFIAINFAVSILLNILFIYHFDYVGAAIIKLFTELLGLVFFAYLVSRYLTLLSIGKYLLKPALACLIMLLLGNYFSYWHLAGLIPFCCLIYLSSLLLLRAFTVEEIKLVKSLLPIKIYSRQ